MDELSFAIRVTDGSVKAAFDELDNRVKKAEQGVDGLSVTGARAFRGLAAGAGIATTALTAMVGAATGVWKVTADNIDAQTKLASTLGLTYAEYERLRYAAEAAGTSQEVLNGSLRRFTIGLSTAISGTGPAADALGMLKLNAADLANVPLDQALARVSEAMQGVENASDRAAIATALFGRQGLQMLPLLQADVKALGDEAERMGLTLAAIDTAAIDNAGDAFDRVSASLGAVTNRFVADLAPAMEALADEIFGTTDAMGEFGGAGTIAADVITNAIGLLINAFTAVKGVVQIFTGVVMELGAFGADVFTGLIAGVNAFWQPFKQMINGWIQIHNLIFEDKKWPLLGDLEQAVNNSAQFADNLRGAARDLEDTGAGNVAAGLTGSADDAFQARVEANRAKAARDAEEAAKNLGGGTAAGFGNDGESSAEKDKKDKKDAKTKTAEEWEDEINKIIEAAAREAEVENERYAQKKKRAAQYLADLEKAGMDELELLALQHEEKMAQLGEMRQQELISKEKFDNAMLQLEEQYQAQKVQSLLKGNSALQQVSKAYQQGEMQGMLAFFAQGLSVFASNSKKVFELSKAAKLAQAAITLPETVMNAYNAGMLAGGPAGPAVGAAYAAVALATQLAQIRAIQSSSFGGGASAPAPSSGGGAVAAAGANGGASGPVAPQRFVNISLGGDDTMYSKATVRGLIERINEEVKDGAVLGVT